MKNKHEQLVCADLFRDQRVLVLGLGKTGLSCARFLAERDVDFSIMDSRKTPPGIDALNKYFPRVDCLFGGFDINAIKNYDVLLVSPGISIKEPIIKNALEHNKKIIGDVEVFALQKHGYGFIGRNGATGKYKLCGWRKYWCARA